MAHDLQFAWSLYHAYESFHQEGISNRRFKHSDITIWLNMLKDNHLFKIDSVGKSHQGREIFLVSIGRGPKKIFCWSQMHGDEPTATMAMFDIFNFFVKENHFAEFKDYLLSSVTLFFIPMVNPDGAEKFQRRNVLGIDINRDAKSQQAVESQILYNTFDSIKPDFGFNLHDQDRDYSAGISNRGAAISFLAPPFDYRKTINEGREKAMKLIAELSKMLADFIPGHVAKYEDDYEPRAFGDNFSKSGSAIILIESGVWDLDREKQFLRKINFITLLTAFKSIADESYINESLEEYQSIPYNEHLMMDFIIRNVKTVNAEKEIYIDIGINYEEINFNDDKDFYLKGRIEDLGDLSVFTGYEEIDATGLTLQLGKTNPQTFSSIGELEKIDPRELYRNGFTNVQSKRFDGLPEFSPYPFNIKLSGQADEEKLKVDDVPNFILIKDNQPRLAVINGFLCDPLFLHQFEGNGLVIS